MERGSDTHGPRKDDALKAELSGQLGSAGGHREEWADPEPPADDDPVLLHDRVETRDQGESRDEPEEAAATRTAGDGATSGPVDPE